MSGGLNGAYAEERHPADQAHRADDPGAVVAEEVGAAQGGVLPASVDVAAGDGTGRSVRILDDRRLQPRRSGTRRPARSSAFPSRMGQPKLFPPTTGAGQVIHFLPQVLAHIADPQVSGGPIKAPAPRIAQAELPDLPAPAGPAHIGVVRRGPHRASHHPRRAGASCRAGRCCPAEPPAATGSGLPSPRPR